MEIYAISALVLIACMTVCCIMTVKNLNITIAVKHEYPERTVEPSNIEVSEADDDDVSFDDVSFDDLLKEVNAFMLDDDEVKDNG